MGNMKPTTNTVSVDAKISTPDKKAVAPLADVGDPRSSRMCRSRSWRSPIFASLDRRGGRRHGRAVAR